MTTKTLTWVSGVGDKPDRYGNYYVNVSFNDDTAGFLGGKPEKVEEHFTALTALIGQPSEFTLEEKGQTGKGKPKFKINAYPGWERPQAQGGGSGGGKRDYVPRFTDTAEGFLLSDERVDRRRSLELAVQVFASGRTVSTEAPGPFVAKIADAYYDFLRHTVSAPPVVAEKPGGVPSDPPPFAPPGATSRPEANTGTTPSTANGEQPGPSEGDTTSTGRDDVVAGPVGEGGTCPPHSLNQQVQARGGRYPCAKCGGWFKP